MQLHSYAYTIPFYQKQGFKDAVKVSKLLEIPKNPVLVLPNYFSTTTAREGNVKIF